MFALPKLSKQFQRASSSTQSRIATRQENQFDNSTATTTASTDKGEVVPPKGKEQHQTKQNTNATKKSLVLVGDQQEVEPVRVVPLAKRGLDTSRSLPDPHVAYGTLSPTSRQSATATKDLNILSHEFPEITSYLTGSENHKQWSSWTRQSINHGTTPVQLKTG